MFKVNDIVITTSDHARMIVRAVDSSGNADCPSIWAQHESAPNGSLHCFNVNRLELAEPIEPKPEPKPEPKFKVGDVVRASWSDRTYRIRSVIGSTDFHYDLGDCTGQERYLTLHEQWDDRFAFKVGEKVVSTTTPFDRVSSNPYIVENCWVNDAGERVYRVRSSIEENRFMITTEDLLRAFVKVEPKFRVHGYVVARPGTLGVTYEEGLCLVVREEPQTDFLGAFTYTVSPDGDNGRNPIAIHEKSLMHWSTWKSLRDAKSRVDSRIAEAEDALAKLRRVDEEREKANAACGRANRALNVATDEYNKLKKELDS